MIFSYDTVKFPFEKITQSYLGCDDLTLVHKNSLFKQTLAEGTDQAQFLHKKFYNSMDTDSKQRFVTIYRQLIREVIFSFYREPILFQRFPTFRVHQPSNIAVFKWHRDRDFNHHPKTVNYFLPVTKAFGTNTFWYQKNNNEESYVPMELDCGQVAQWDGANCRHGNKTNKTNQTRISFDFRVLKEKDYDPLTIHKSITQSMTFKIGEYYDIMT